MKTPNRFIVFLILSLSIFADASPVSAGSSYTGWLGRITSSSIGAARTTTTVKSPPRSSSATTVKPSPSSAYTVPTTTTDGTTSRISGAVNKLPGTSGTVGAMAVPTGQNPGPIISFVPPPKIVFQSNRDFNPLVDGINAGSTHHIWVINGDGKGATPLTQSNKWVSFNAVLSPDGMRVLFTSDRALDPAIDDILDTENLWVMNIDGSNPQPLTKLTAKFAMSGDPSWSPDGKKIVFSSTRDLNPAIDGTNGGRIGGRERNNIWVVNADGSAAQALTRLSSDAQSSHAKWSPDGTKIVFVSTRDLNPDVDGNNGDWRSNLWVMNADGTGAHPLTTKLEIDSGPYGYPEPDWSPDGTRIAFTTWDRQSYIQNIWTIKVDGTGLTPLTQLLNADADLPKWSPNGTMIAYESTRDLNPMVDAAMTAKNVWVMNPDGTGTKPLTQLRLAVSNRNLGLGIKWARDGRTLFFHSDRDLNPMIDGVQIGGNLNLWVVDGMLSHPITTLKKAWNGWPDL